MRIQLVKEIDSYPCSIINCLGKQVIIAIAPQGTRFDSSRCTLFLGDAIVANGRFGAAAGDIGILFNIENPDSDTAPLQVYWPSRKIFTSMKFKDLELDAIRVLNETRHQTFKALLVEE